MVGGGWSRCRPGPTLHPPQAWEGEEWGEGCLRPPLRGEEGAPGFRTPLSAPSSPRNRRNIPGEGGRPPHLTTPGVWTPSHTGLTLPGVGPMGWAARWWRVTRSTGGAPPGSASRYRRFVRSTSTTRGRWSDGRWGGFLAIDPIILKP